MITLPTIDVPTAFVAVVATVVGNWLKDEYFRWRQKIESSKSEKIRWYKETIQICERVKTTHSLLEEFDSVRQDSYIDSVMETLKSEYAIIGKRLIFHIKKRLERNHLKN